MNIKGINQYAGLAFCGVKKPYTNNNGVKITPISVDPTEKDIKDAIQSTKTSKKPMEGFNGYAYWLGEDLVVKKYKGINAINNDPSREINLLDNLYDNNLVFNNSQVGSYAFEMPNGETYLVSTKVQGKNPDPVEAPFTRENLESLTEIILQMEKGSHFPNSSQNGYSDRCRFMNYDFNGGNMKVTSNKAGMFDYEYSQKENLDDQILNVVLKKPSGPNCNQSDTSGLPSNMRSFEYWTLCDYLKASDNANELFNDYLEIKGKYHNEMTNFYNDFAKESNFPEACKEIAKKESAHARLLRKDENGQIPSDIKKAETRKIQMSNFMYIQSPFAAIGKVNTDQLLEYSNETIDYFNECLNQAQQSNDTDRITYYKDCVELMSSWKDVRNVIDWQFSNPNQRFLDKLTDEHITTLDDVLTF